MFIHECASGNLIKLPLYLYTVPTSYQNNYSLRVYIALVIPYLCRVIEYASKVGLELFNYQINFFGHLKNYFFTFFFQMQIIKVAQSLQFGTRQI